MRSLYADLADPARDRRAGRQGRQGRRRTRPRQAKPVQRRLQERQPRARGQGASSRRAEGLRQQPRGLPDGRPVTADFVMGSYSGSSRSRSRSGCPTQARPVYHRKRDSIEAHLTIVFAALAVSRRTEAQTGWSIRRFVKTACRYRTVEIQAGQHLTASAGPFPDDLRQAPRSHQPRQPRCALIVRNQATTLIRRCLALRRKPLSEFTTEDLRLMPGQNPDARDRNGSGPEAGHLRGDDRLHDFRGAAEDLREPV